MAMVFRIVTTAVVATIIASIAIRIATISTVSRHPNLTDTSLVMTFYVVAMVAITDDPPAFDPNIVRNVAPVTVAMADMNRGVVVAISIKRICND
ncbi:MAG: hypothetical protein CMI16_15315 [Opitutaceae bacterium]|nr:hypothetical protein [Opitutaceae bacterium]|tara:strand:- start:1295 stop:1579 length:285 start_codon:yes stop_codon:yes gene_type:complete